MRNKRSGRINIQDAHLSIWEEDVDQDTLKKEVMLKVCNEMHKWGWGIHVPYDDYADGQFGKKVSRRFAETHRKGIRNGLECEVSVSGRCIKFEFWENIIDHTHENSNGGRYIFDKESKMPYLTRQRCLATKLKLVRYLQKHWGYEVSDKSKPIIEKRISAHELITTDNRQCWHYKEELDRRDWNIDSNRKSADGQLLDEYMTVYARGYDGRWIKGVTRYNINNMWWIVVGKWERKNIACFDIYVEKPEDLHVRVSNRVAERRIVQHQKRCIDNKYFIKAHHLEQKLASLKAA